jgi:hypothetical protein
MTKKRILGCLRVPPVEYHCSIVLAIGLGAAAAEIIYALSSVHLG